LSKSERSLLAGLSSPQIAAYRDTMSSREWRNFQQDLSSSQRRDTGKVLAGDVVERRKAISGATPTKNPTMDSINALTNQINALIAATTAGGSVVNFNGNIGSSVDYNAAFQQAAFFARGMR
jgi:isoaspartyl peptidase/L-asparaginase-like protein (Ntn-hydrolase superfamily)